MKKQIHFAKVTLAVYMPVCSRTREEAAAIARENLGDFLSTRLRELDEKDIEIDFLLEQPPRISDEQIVWGECVPEEHAFVDSLREHLAEQPL